MNKRSGLVSRGGRHGRPAGRLGMVLAAVGVCLFLAGCGAITRGDKPGPESQVFTGTVSPTCGPTDGPGLQFDLAPSDARAAISVSIGLWGGEIGSGSFVKHFTNGGEGAGRWCPLLGDCIQASIGTVWFDVAPDGTSASGAFRLDAVRGEHLEGTFSVTIDSAAPLMCG